MVLGEEEEEMGGKGKNFLSSSLIVSFHCIWYIRKWQEAPFEKWRLFFSCINNS